MPPSLAAGLGLADGGDAEGAAELRGAQLAGISRFTPLAIASTLVIATILAVSLRDAGRLGWAMQLWCASLGAVLVRYGISWLRGRRRRNRRLASRLALRRAVVHGAIVGGIWGVMPGLALPGAPPLVQVLVGCVTAGMMCVGGFILSTVPLAGIVYVLAIACGTSVTLLVQVPGGSGLLVLLWIHACVVIACLCCSAQVYIEHVLAEARLRAEMAALDRAHRELRLARRLSALGELAGGVAHDFNNVLQSITGDASLVACRGGDAHGVRALAGNILQAAERGGAISRRLLSFVRQDEFAEAPADLGGILDSAQDLLRHVLPPSITVTVVAAPDLPFVRADRPQLESVLVNLAANARDAMPGGGVIALDAMAERLEVPQLDPPLAAGDYVRLSVTDTGEGMRPEVLDRALEPFFTTKPRGLGTGLGLSMAQAFAAQCGGALAIDSAAGIGTVVTLWLPQAAGGVGDILGAYAASSALHRRLDCQTI